MLFFIYFAIIILGDFMEIKDKILYEDNHLVVCYKDYGILSQEDSSKASDMLNLLKDYIKEKYNKPGAVFLGLVHRLDRNTEGVMVYARTSKAASRLSEAIRNNTFNKRYIAVAEGSMDSSGTLIDKLSKDEKNRKAYIDNKNGKEAILKYTKLLEAKINGVLVSYVEIELVTGRFHQIRCQLANIGHPLFGDTKYGSKNFTDKPVLQAYSLTFIHPTTKEEMVFKKVDFTNNFENLRGKYEA